MADELLPCPFCGASPEIITDGRHTWGLLEHKVGCLWYFGNFPKHEIPERDFEAWNNRDACFRCQYGAKPMTEENMRELGWVRERTCYPERPMFDGFPIVNGPLHCSQCGMEWERLPIRPAYCPTCGAKVMQE